MQMYVRVIYGTCYMHPNNIRVISDIKSVARNTCRKMASVVISTRVLVDMIFLVLYSAQANPISRRVCSHLVLYICFLQKSF